MPLCDSFNFVLTLAKSASLDAIDAADGILSGAAQVEEKEHSASSVALVNESFMFRGKGRLKVCQEKLLPDHETVVK